jgi:hypothetical protein
VPFSQATQDFTELTLDHGRLRTKLLHVNDSLHLGLGELQFKLSNVSGLLQRVASLANTTTLSFANVTHHLGQLIDGVNVTALREQFEAVKAYVAFSMTMQVLLNCLLHGVTLRRVRHDVVSGTLLETNRVPSLHSYTHFMKNTVTVYIFLMHKLNNSLVAF